MERSNTIGCQDFFKKRWQQRIWRIKKRFMPILISALFVFGLIVIFSQLLQIQFTHEGGRVMIFAHTLLAVGLGIIVVLIGDCLHLRRKSHFLPIRIMIRRRKFHDS
jgi:cell division protein FtsW (lipid II flippase)